MLSASPHRSEHESSCCTKRCCAMFSGPHSAVIKDEPSSPSPAFEKNVHGSASSHAQVDCTVSDSVSSDVPVSSSSLPRRSLRAVRPPRVASPVSFSSSTSFKKTRASKSGVPSRVLKKPEASSSSAKTSSRRLEGVSTTVCNQTNVLEESRSTRKETTLALKVRKNAVEKKDFHSKFPVFRTRPLTLTAVKAEVEDNENVEAEESLKGQKALRRSQRRGKRSFIERFKTPSNSVRKESKSSANDDGTSVRKAGDFDEFSGSVAMKPELLVEDIVENSATATSSQILLPGNCSSSTSTSFAVSCTPSSFSSSPEHSVTPDTYYCLQAYSPLPFPAVYESCTPEFLNMRSAITALLELDKLFPQPDCNPPPSMTFEAELLDMIERNQMQTQNPWLELTEQEIMEMIEKHKLRYPPPDVDTRKAGILSMKDKLDIFDRYERGEDIASIARYHAIAPSRVISIVKSAWSVNDRTGTLMPMSSNQKGPGYHHMALEKLEKILVKWMKEENRHVFMSQSAVQAKALEIWADLQKAGEGSKLSFTASRGWFSRFRRRARLFKLRSGCWSTENPRQFPARTNHIFENVVPEPSDGSISENMSQIMPTAVSGTVFEVSSDADEEKQVTHLPLHEVLSAIISSSRSDSNSTIYVQRDLIDEPITAILRPQCPPDTLSSFNHSSLSPLPRDHSAAEVQTDVKSESDDIMEEIFNAVIDRKPEVTSCGEPEACNTSDVMEYSFEVIAPPSTSNPKPDSLNIIDKAEEKERTASNDSVQHQTMFASDLIKRRCAQSDSDSSIVHNSNSTTEDEIDVVTILPSPPRKLQKCELTSQNEEPIVVIDDSDQRSNSFNAELIGISPCSARKDTQMQGHQEEAVVLNYINLGVVFIADAIKTSRFAIGSKQRLISAIMVSVSEPLRIIDNLWTMSIVISDDSYSGLECLVSHSALYELIGFRPEEAMEIRRSSDKSRRKEGTNRLRAVQQAMDRLDVLWHIEFFAAIKTTPVIKKIETLAQRLRLVD